MTSSVRRGCLTAYWRGELTPRWVADAANGRKRLRRSVGNESFLFVSVSRDAIDFVCS